MLNFFQEYVGSHYSIIFDILSSLKSSKIQITYLMKTYFIIILFLLLCSCHNGNTNVSTGNNTIINDFPVTQTVESEKIDLEILGVNRDIQ